MALEAQLNPLNVPSGMEFPGTVQVASRNTDAAKAAAYRKKYPDRVRRSRLASYSKHREKRIAESREWWKNNSACPQKKAAARARSAEWRKNNPGRQDELKRRWESTPQAKAKKAAYNRNLRIKSPQYRMKCRLRARLGALISGKRHKSTEKLIGCTYEEFMTHLQASFVDGMNWNNHDLWEIDHIKPCASFDLASKEGQEACFHYSNMRPLWKHLNRSKGARHGS